MYVVINQNNLKSSCERDDYNIKKAAKDIADKTKKATENSKKQ